MPRAKPLTAAAVAKLAAPGRYAVGDGAYLQVSKWGTKSWVFRYSLGVKARHMGLGPYPLRSLAEAREKARNARKSLLDGVDPLQARREKRAQFRLAAAKGMTFRDCAERMMASHGTAWKNLKHRQQWTNTLATYAYPVFGTVGVIAIDTGSCLRRLSRSGPRSLRRRAACADELKQCWTMRRRAAGARARTQRAGAVISTSSCQAVARCVACRAIRQCPMPRCRLGPN
jgi:hypothetical protein